MAILGKIRDKSVLLIAFIALALFAFLIGDVIQSGAFNSQPQNIGEVNGQNINAQQFSMKVANVEKSQSISSIQAMNRVWDQEVNLALMNTEVEKLGLRVSEAHLIEALKAMPELGQQPIFLNELGMFDIQKYRQYYVSAQSDEERNYLDILEKNAEVTSKYQLYANMVRGGFFTTLHDAKSKYSLANDKVSFQYVNVPFSSINDSEVTVTDEEIIAYMKKNEKKYKSEETRELEYVVIYDTATDQDKGEVRERVQSLLDSRIVYNKETNSNDTIPGFASTNDVIDFVNNNSDFPFDSTYVAKSDLPAEFAEQLYNLEKGAVFGPYQYGDYFAISKSMGKKAGAKAKARHILIGFEGTQVQTKEIRNKEQAQVKANELLAKISTDRSQFAQLAMEHSEDPGSGAQGGDLGYFGPGAMVEAFDSFVFNNSIGKLGVVETNFGFHIIEITDKQDAIQLATIAQKIEASSKTIDEAYSKAAKFEYEAGQNKAFADIAAELKMDIQPSVRVKAMDENLGSMGQQRAAIRWAFEKGTKVNDVKRFEIPNVGHAVVRVKNINKDGLMSIEDARLTVEPILKNEKKAALIVEKMKGASLEAIASANNVTVMSAEGVGVEAPILVGLGFEPKVVGRAFATSTDAISAPIQGQNGIYVIGNATVTKAPETTDYSAQINSLRTAGQAAVGKMFSTLKELADIKDNRAKFNY